LKKIILAHFSLFIANLIYAINYSFAKDVMPIYITPSGFILLRVIGAFVLFSIVYYIFIKEKIEKEDILRLSACGLFGVAINQLLFFEGLNLTTPINAAIVMTINPVLVIFLSFIIINDPITIRKSFGIIMGLFGASFLILQSGNLEFLNSHFKGNLLVLINATSYGVYLVIVKPMMKKYHPITVMYVVFGMGLLYVFPFGINDLLDVEWDLIPHTVNMQIFFVVFFTTFVAYLCNSLALQHLKPTTVSIYIYLQPVLATAFAIFWGSDFLDTKKIIAAIFIFFGVYLVSARTKS